MHGARDLKLLGGFCRKTPQSSVLDVDLNVGVDLDVDMKGYGTIC
jgi:hypothetical protein